MTSMDMFKAKSQLIITLLWIGIVGGITIGGALGKLDTTKVDMAQLWTLTGVVLFFWFNRSRDGSETPTVPTSVTVTQVKDNAKT